MDVAAEAEVEAVDAGGEADVEGAEDEVVSGGVLANAPLGCTESESDFESAFESDLAG